MCRWMKDTETLAMLSQAAAEGWSWTRRQGYRVPASAAPANSPLDGRAGAKSFLWSWNEVTLEDGSRVPAPCGISAAVFLS
jgi:hypothetical protein